MCIRKNPTTCLTNQKLGNNLAVFDIYLPFVGVFNLMVIKSRGFRHIQFYTQNLWNEVMYVMKLREIHQRCGCKKMQDFEIQCLISRSKNFFTKPELNRWLMIYKEVFPLIRVFL